MGLELGGKDPAYVRADADVAFAAENLADGSFFNSGQSCCGIERIYVHEDVYDEFVQGVVDVAKGYKLGNPLDDDVTIGPLAKATRAEAARSAPVTRVMRYGAVVANDATPPAVAAERPDFDEEPVELPMRSFLCGLFG